MREAKSNSVAQQQLDLLQNYQRNFANSKKIYLIDQLEIKNEKLITIRSFAVFLTPITAKAASHKLLVKVNQYGKISTSVLTMSGEKACEEGKKKVLQNSE